MSSKNNKIKVDQKAQLEAFENERTLTVEEVKERSKAIISGAIDKDLHLALHLFNEIIDSKPASAWVDVNPYSGNAKFLPIRITETLLRSIFGVFQVEPAGEAKLIGNSVTVRVILKVYHPIMKQWLSYSGIGATPVQVEKGSSPVDFSKINAQGLHKTIPAAEGFAFQNAAKKIGKIFGSDLNSKDVHTLNIIDVHKVKESSSIMTQVMNGSTTKTEA